MMTADKDVLKSKLAVQIAALKCAISCLEDAVKPHRLPVPPGGMEPINGHGTIPEVVLTSALNKMCHLEQALVRIDDNPHFDRCTVCKQTISFERLLAVPVTNRCARCSLSVTR